MYYTLEELQKEHPVGSVYHIYWNDIYEWCYTETDIKLFKQKHPNIRNFKQNSDGMVWCQEKHENTVDGYIFDGKYWYPAIQTWDGWIPIDEEEINTTDNK